MGFSTTFVDSDRMSIPIASIFQKGQDKRLLVIRIRCIRNWYTLILVYVYYVLTFLHASAA